MGIEEEGGNGRGHGRRDPRHAKAGDGAQRAGKRITGPRYLHVIWHTDWHAMRDPRLRGRRWRRFWTTPQALTRCRTWCRDAPEGTGVLQAGGIPVLWPAFFSQDGAGKPAILICWTWFFAVTVICGPKYRHL